MMLQTFIGFVHNASLLISLGLLYDSIILNKYFKRFTGQVLTGIVLGLIGIAIMLTPWVFMPGIVFDTRSILLSLGGLFFGTVPVLIAMAVTGLLRLYQGGLGAWTGVSVILASGILGLLLRHRRQRSLENISYLDLYLFGIVVHIAMMLLMLTLPRPVSFDVLAKVSLPLMLIYPVGTVLMGKLLLMRLHRHRSEQTLRNREEQFRSLAENSQDYIIRYGRDGRRLYENPAVLSAGAREGKAGGETPPLAGQDEASSQLWEGKIAEVIDTKRPSQCILDMEGPDGPLYLDRRLFPEFMHDGTVDTVLGISRDVTPMKQAEEKLVQALGEKETLLRELFHRTKNTLQVIRSMLLLQAAAAPRNEDVQKLVQDTDNRIMAMALVHERLYRSQNLSRIEMSDYLRELAQLTLHSYETESQRIALVFDTEKESLLIDTAIPCGLIVFELVSNAVKYAFPGRERGEISIRLFRNSRNDIELQVADDGIGLPQGFDFRKQETFGFQIIKATAEHQLQGTIELSGAAGVSCAITFPDNLYEERV